jgi:hypothetical protein
MCIVQFGVDFFEDGSPIGSHMSEYGLSGLLRKQLPLLIFHPLHAVKETIHCATVVSLVVLIKPKFVEVDEETQKRRQLAASGNFVNSLETVIFHEGYDSDSESFRVTISSLFSYYGELCRVGSCISRVDSCISCAVSEVGYVVGD